MAKRSKSAKPRVEVKEAVNEARSPKKASYGNLEAAKGKLGVMIPGMGAVATTFVAGVEAIRKGIAKPIGSLTQMGTIRLGKRTDGRSPKVKEFVPLAELDDLVFTGWDIFEDNMYRRRYATPASSTATCWSRSSPSCRRSSRARPCSITTT